MFQEHAGIKIPQVNLGSGQLIILKMIVPVLMNSLSQIRIDQIDSSGHRNSLLLMERLFLN
jgi:hypothetical protein